MLRLVRVGARAEPVPIREMSRGRPHLLAVQLPTAFDLLGLQLHVGGVGACLGFGKDTTNQVFFDDVFVPDDYLVGKQGKGFQMISEALDLERFTMFTLSPIAHRSEVLVDWVKQAKRDDVPLKDDTNVNAGWDTRATGGTVDNLRSPAAYTDGNWHLIFGWFQQGETPDKQLFVDTEAVITATAHGGNDLGSGTTRFGFIGVGSEAAVVDGTTGPNRFLAGDLVELIIYPHARSDEERRQLERYFIHRYSG